MIGGLNRGWKGPEASLVLLSVVLGPELLAGSGEALEAFSFLTKVFAY